ncbi:MAG: MarR family transcriptional regulator [Chloroflexi bacterium]|nr:MarR family transcriptional regulator [Chloroflexota bacterium]
MAHDHSLGLRSFLILCSLPAQGQVSFKELSHLLAVPKSALTGLIDHLQEKGLVERRQDQQDRRRWFIALTQRGQRITQKIREEEEAKVIRPVLQQLAETEAEAFLKVTEALQRELAVILLERKPARRSRVSKLANRKKGG